MIKKIVFCCFFILCLSGCGEEHRFMTLCRTSDSPTSNGSATPCKCMYNGISKNVKDMKHYNDWLTVYVKLGDTLNMSILKEAKKLQASMGAELWEQYIGLLNRYMMMCSMFDEEDVDKAMEELKGLEGTPERKDNKNINNSSKNYYPSQSYRAQIPSKLVLDLSKNVYEKDENIALVVQWLGNDVDCKLLEEQVKATLMQRHFEIIKNTTSCAANDINSFIELRTQFKSPRIGKLNIPSIQLETVSSKSVDFTVRDLVALQNAIETKNIESVKTFLLAPEDLNKIKIDGKSPVAHFIKDDTGFAKELVKLGASPNEIDENGYTPLMYAVIRQDNELLDLLLNKNVNLNEFDKKGRTAIMYAAIKNNIYAAKKLVEHKADLYKSQDSEWNAYKYAKELKHKEVEEITSTRFDEIIFFSDDCESCSKKREIFKEYMKNYQSLKITYRPYSSLSQYTSENYEYGPIVLFRKNKKNERFMMGWSGNTDDLLRFL